MGPFDFIASITNSKKYLLEDGENEKAYVPFIINRSLSSHLDTLLYANQMNMNGHLDKKLQYDFLFNAVSKKKRWAKWNKRKKDDDVDLVSQYYKYNVEKAKAVLPLLSEDHLKQIRKELEQGGMNK